MEHIDHMENWGQKEHRYRTERRERRESIQLELTRKRDKRMKKMTIQVGRKRTVVDVPAAIYFNAMNIDRLMEGLG